MKELFKEGLSFRSFILNQDSAHRGKFMKYYIPIEIKDETRIRVNQISSKINILGVVDGQCPDCHINLSILEKLISTNPNISLGLITEKDAEGRLESEFLIGELKVPTFVFLDENFKEKAVFIEKPEAVKNIDVDTLEGAKVQMSYKAGKLAEETALEFLLLLEKTA